MTSITTSIVLRQNVLVSHVHVVLYMYLCKLFVRKRQKAGQYLAFYLFFPNLINKGPLTL